MTTTPPEEKKMGGEMARVEKDGAFWDVVVDVPGAKLPLYFSCEEEFHAVRKCEMLNTAHAARVRPLVEALKQAADALGVAIDYIHGDELTHGRDFGTGNQCRKALRACCKVLVEVYRNGK